MQIAIYSRLLKINFTNTSCVIYFYFFLGLLVIFRFNNIKNICCLYKIQSFQNCKKQKKLKVPSDPILLQTTPLTDNYNYIPLDFYACICKYVHLYTLPKCNHTLHTVMKLCFFHFYLTSMMGILLCQYM